MTLQDRILAAIGKNPKDFQAYDDLFAWCRNEEEKDFKGAHAMNEKLRQLVGARVVERDAQQETFFDLYKRTLLFDAPHKFDSYLQYLEIGRRPQDRFYQPRRRVLKKAVDLIQKLEDGEIEEGFISQPPRTGKTSLLMFYLTWLIGKDSEKSNLYSAYSDTITKAMYNGVLEIINDPVTYLWHDVFPTASVVQTNSADETLNIDRKKRYPSLTCRSLYGTLNGACDCNGVLISDDLIGGIEEALSKDRMISAWSKVDNNFLPRAKEQAKILWCGTRWSVIDPQGIRQDLLENDEAFRNRKVEIINLPALNSEGESNFNYDYGVGFSTEFYRQRRASFEKNNDMASWLAQYMGEPIERAGTVFTPDDFMFYNGELPDAVDSIVLPVDPAFGGGDYVAGPVGVVCDDKIYVADVVYDDGDKKVTLPLIVKLIEKWGVQRVQVEATKATAGYPEELSQLLKERGLKVNVITKPAPTDKGKHERIFDKAPDIRERCVFLESGKRSPAYERFMQNVYSFKLYAKKQHDDAPDSLSMLIDMVLHKIEKGTVFKRQF